MVSIYCGWIPIWDHDHRSLRLTCAITWYCLPSLVKSPACGYSAPAVMIQRCPVRWCPGRTALSDAQFRFVEFKIGIHAFCNTVLLPVSSSILGNTAFNLSKSTFWITNCTGWPPRRFTEMVLLFILKALPSLNLKGFVIIFNDIACDLCGLSDQPSPPG